MDPRLAEVRGYVRAIRDRVEAKLRRSEELVPGISVDPADTETIRLCDTLLSIMSASPSAPVVHTEPLRFVAAGGAK